MFLLPLDELLCEVLFERKQAPEALLRDILGRKFYDDEIRHDGHGDRALDALRIFGDLMLAQSRRPLQFFHEQLHCPPPAIHIDHLPGRHVWEIGHQNLRRFRPIVAPFLTQNDGDIANVSETSPFGIGPIRSTPAWFIQRHPAASER